MSLDLKNLTIEKAHQSLKDGVFSCRELAEEYLKVIKEKNGELNAYLEVFDDVLEQAETAQKKFEKGEATILTGIPFAIKDIILIENYLNKGVSVEEFLDYICNKYDFLLHGSIHKIEEKIKSKNGKIFAANKAAIAIERSLS